MKRPIKTTLSSLGLLLASNYAFANPSYTVTDLGSFYPNGINNNSQVVGYSYTNDAAHAFLWSNGAIDRPQFLCHPPGGNDLDTAAINDSGQIIAHGTNGHAYLLTPTVAPVPEARSS